MFCAKPVVTTRFEECLPLKKPRQPRERKDPRKVYCRSVLSKSLDSVKTDYVHCYRDIAEVSHSQRSEAKAPASVSPSHLKNVLSKISRTSVGFAHRYTQCRYKSERPIPLEAVGNWQLYSAQRHKNAKAARHRPLTNNQWEEELCVPSSDEFSDECVAPFLPPIGRPSDDSAAVPSVDSVPPPSRGTLEAFLQQCVLLQPTPQIARRKRENRHKRRESLLRRPPTSLESAPLLSLPKMPEHVPLPYLTPQQLERARVARAKAVAASRAAMTGSDENDGDDDHTSRSRPGPAQTSDQGPSEDSPPLRGVHLHFVDSDAGNSSDAEHVYPPRKAVALLGASPPHSGSEAASGHSQRHSRHRRGRRRRSSVHAKTDDSDAAVAAHNSNVHTGASTSENERAPSWSPPPHARRTPTSPTRTLASPSRVAQAQAQAQAQGQLSPTRTLTSPSRVAQAQAQGQGQLSPTRALASPSRVAQAQPSSPARVIDKGSSDEETPEPLACRPSSEMPVIMNYRILGEKTRAHYVIFGELQGLIPINTLGEETLTYRLGKKLPKLRGKEFARSEIFSLQARAHFGMSQMETLCQIFQYCAGGSKEMSYRQFESLPWVFHRTGKNTVRRLFNAFDYDRNNSLSFGEFVLGLGKLFSGTCDDHLELVFRFLDRHSNDSVGYQELLDVLQRNADDLFDLPQMCKVLLSLITVENKSGFSLSQFKEAVERDGGPVVDVVQPLIPTLPLAFLHEGSCPERWRRFWGKDMEHPCARLAKESEKPMCFTLELLLDLWKYVQSKGRQHGITVNEYRSVMLTTFGIDFGNRSTILFQLLTKNVKEHLMDFRTLVLALNFYFRGSISYKTTVLFTLFGTHVGTQISEDPSVSLAEFQEATRVSRGVIGQAIASQVALTRCARVFERLGLDHATGRLRLSAFSKLCEEKPRYSHIFTSPLPVT